MRRKKNRDINVFSASAIDLFASSMGVFIILVVILFPYFGNKSKTESTPTQLSMKEQFETLQKEIEQTRQDLVKKDEVIEKQNQKITQQEETIEDLQAKIEDSEKTVKSISQIEKKTEDKDLEIKKLKKQVVELDEAKKKIKKLERQLLQTDQTDLVAELKQKEKKDRKEIDELRKQVKELEKTAQPDQSKVLAKLKQEKQIDQQQIKDLQEKIKQLKEKDQRNIASVKSHETLQKTIERLQKEVEKSQQASLSQSQSQKKLENQLQMTQRKLQQEVTRASNLKKQLEDNTGRQDDKSFLAIVLKWSTYKHDIDLVVSSPEGKVYNYKRKSHSGYPGEFVLDSRSGPGAEVWQSSELSPGDYTLTSNLYNNYGNDKPADVSASIFTKQGKVDVPKFSLSLQNRKKIIKFRVDKDGAVEFK